MATENDPVIQLRMPRWGGWEHDPDLGPHLGILWEAHRIYRDRNAVRGDMWRTRPPSNKLEMIQEKLDRTEAAYNRIQQIIDTDLNAGILESLTKEYEDSLLDLINFAAFGIRQVREGARG